MKLKTVICNHCKTPFERDIKQVTQNEKRGRKNYCSQTCVHNHRKTEEKQIKCDFCSVLFLRKTIDSDQLHNFCSCSCSAKHTNFERKQNHKTKQERPRNCKICNIEFAYKTKTKFCNSCTPTSNLNISKGILFAKRANWQSARSAIQQMARKNYFFANPDAFCHICNYKTHVEVAHKQSVSSFPDETLLSTINDISNLVGLCPNHHWEYDNGLLVL